MGRLSTEEVNRLAAEASRCSRDAFDRLVEAYCRPLLSYIRVRLRDPSEAEDVAQEVWGEVWKGIHTPPEQGGFDPEKGRSFYTYVISRYAKYAVRSARCKAHIRREILGEEDERQGLDAWPSDGPTPATIAELREEAALRLRAYDESFRLLFLIGGYPHQQLAFAYSKLIYGKKSHRGIEGKPQRVDEEHGARPLDRVTALFWQDFQSASGLPDEVLRRFDGHLAPLRAELRRALKEVLKPHDQASRRHLHALLRSIVGETCLRQYYGGGGHTKSIPDWCEKVEARIRRALGLERGASADEAIEWIARRRGD